MRVLLLAEDDGLYLRGAEALQARGHEVIGCHEAGAAADRWPCDGVTGSCPLEAGVDAAVALRRSQASRVEAGIGCVVRQKIPLVLAGAAGGAGNGVAPFAAAVVEGIGEDLVDAVEEVATASIPELSAAATAGLASTAEHRGIEEPLTVEVVRDRRRVSIVIHGPSGLDGPAKAALAQAAFAPVRELIPIGAVDSVDVSFAGDDGSST